MTKRIKLSRGMYAIVDDGVYERLNKSKWYASRGANTWYAIRNHKNPKMVLMHRMIMNAPAGKEVDHVNGNGLDNRRSNLRLCSKTENRRNSKLYANNTSGYKGVYQLPKGNWRARIQVNGKGVHVGVFETAEEAARAYDRAARKHFGEYANTNS